VLSACAPAPCCSPRIPSCAMLALKSPAALMSINCDSGLTRARLPEPSTERLIGTIAATGGFTPSTKVDRRDGQRRGELEPPAAQQADSAPNLPVGVVIPSAIGGKESYVVVWPTVTFAGTARLIYRLFRRAAAPLRQCSLRPLRLHFPTADASQIHRRI